MVWNSEIKGGLSILEFLKARGGLDEDVARVIIRVWNHPFLCSCFVPVSV